MRHSGQGICRLGQQGRQRVCSSGVSHSCLRSSNSTKGRGGEVPAARKWLSGNGIGFTRRGDSLPAKA